MALCMVEGTQTTLVCVRRTHTHTHAHTDSHASGREFASRIIPSVEAAAGL